jgi:hypothetical protein
MLTLTLSIAVTDGTMTEPPYNNPYDPMDAPDKGSYTITRSGEDMSEPLMVPLWVSVTQVGGDAFSYDPNNGYYDPNYGIYNCVSQCAIIPANEDSVTIYTIPNQDGDYDSRVLFFNLNANFTF